MHHATLLPTALLLSLVSAQVSSPFVSLPSAPAVAAPTDLAPGSVPGSGSSTCGSPAVLDQCLQTTQAAALTCASGDFSCLCAKYTSVVGCFASSGCPNDPRWAGIFSNQQSYCADSTIYAVGYTTPISRSVAPVSTAAGASDAAAPKVTGSSSGAGAGSGGGNGGSGGNGSGAKNVATGSGGGAMTATGTGAGSAATGTSNARGLSVREAGAWVVGVAGVVGVLL